MDYINKIICGDCLEVMKGFPDNFVDLIYCDVLYGTGKDYGDYQDLKADKKIIDNFYIPRIKEMHRILKDTGSIYIHCDWHINHWLRLILDEIFGAENFINDIIWSYQGTGTPKKGFKHKHDIILFYSKETDFYFNELEAGEPLGEKQKVKYTRIDEQGKKFKEYRHPDGIIKRQYWEEGKLMRMRDVWDISTIQSWTEKLDFSTQKPEALLERIIKASSNKNDLVADFFCGSGTTLAVAKKLNRNYIGCDISKRACDIANKRIKAIPEPLF